MQSSIRDYVSEGTDIGYSQLKKRFGEPKQIASDYVNEMEPEALARELRNKKEIMGIMVASAVLALALWAGYLTYCYVDFADSINGRQVVEYAVVVEREESREGGN